MPENVITRVVRLLLDRGAAKQTEEDARKSIGGVERSLGGLKKAALAVGAALAAAFGVRAIVNFGKEAVAEFIKGERAQAQLRAAIESTGAAAWTSLEQLQAQAQVMADVTTFATDDIARAQARLLTYSDITGKEFERATMLALDWATALEVDVASGAESLGKALNYPTVALGSLTKQGFIFTEAQKEQIKHFEATGQLARAQAIIMDEVEASFGGSAVAMRNTFGGAVKALTNDWNSFKGEVGAAIVTSEGAAEGMSALSAAVKMLRRWLADNADVLQVWATKAVRLAIDVVDGLYRAVRGLSEIISGVVLTTLGALARATAFSASGFALAFEAAGKFLNFIGAKGAAESAQGMADRIEDLTNKLDAFGRTAVNAGKNLAKSGVGRFTASALGDLTGAPLFELPDEPGDEDGDNGGGGAGAAAKKLKEKTDAVSEALKKLKEEMQVADAMSGVLGDQYDVLRAKSAALEAALTTLVREGAPDEEVAAIAERLQRVRTEMEQGSTAVEEYERQMASIQVSAQMLGGEFDAVGAEIAALERLMSRLSEEGETSAEVMARLGDRLRELKGISQETSLAMQWQGMVAGAMGEAVGAAMGAGLGPFAKNKAKQNLLEAVELKIRSIIAAMNPITAWQAPVYAATAGMHAKLGIAWGALAAVSGGFGGGGSGGGGVAGAPAGAAGGGSASLGAARSVSGPASEKAQAPANEVHIHFVGEGFSAVNPEVQRVVIGAVQESRERYGNNARIYTHRRSG